MFQHGHVNTIKFVERMWYYVNYIFLDGKVNQKLGKLISALIDNPKARLQFGENTLVEHYNDAHLLSTSRKYLKEG
jgi:hypothetical protein